MFFKTSRPDGAYLKGLHHFVKIIPYLMPRRTGASIFISQEIDLTHTLEFLRDFNRKRAEAGRQKKGNEQETAKLLFLIANLQERNAAPPSTEEKKSKLSEALLSTWERVKENWDTYTAYLASHTTVPDYKATADERKKQVDARVQREKDYGAVAERAKNNGSAPAEKKDE